MRKRRSFAFVLTVTGLLTVALLLSAYAQMSFQESTQKGAGSYDAQIQSAVTEELRKHDAFKDVRANVEDGIVTLQGTVPLYREKENAYRRVRNKEHVQGVRTLITVAGKDIPDGQLREQIADKLRYDRVDQGITFNNFNLDVKDGVVTISGQARTPTDADSALSIVSNTPGVKDVIENIDVLPPSPMDDELRIRVARAIYTDPQLQKYALDPQRPIRIVVDHGHVSLFGVVLNAGDKQVAGIRANSVPNVFSVKNNLVVAGEPPKER